METNENGNNWEESKQGEEVINNEAEFERSRDKKEAIIQGIIDEIKWERIRLLIMNVSSWVVFLFCFIINLLWILEIAEAIDLKISVEFRFFVPWFSLPTLIISLILVIYSGLSSYTFEQERKFHFNRVESIDTERVPNFVIDKYKNISGLTIFYNWFAGFSYVVAAIVLGYFFLFRNREMVPLPGGLEISLADGKSFPSYGSDIVWTFIFIGIVFILHITIIIFAVREKSRLTAIFDLRKRLDYEEIKKYERKINIICFVLFMLPVLILFISYWVSKRLRKK